MKFVWSKRNALLFLIMALIGAAGYFCLFKTAILFLENSAFESYAGLFTIPIFLVVCGILATVYGVIGASITKSKWLSFLALAAGITAINIVIFVKNFTMAVGILLAICAYLIEEMQLEAVLALPMILFLPYSISAFTFFGGVVIGRCKGKVKDWLLSFLFTMAVNFLLICFYIGLFHFTRGFDIFIRFVLFVILPSVTGMLCSVLSKKLLPTILSNILFYSFMMLLSFSLSMFDVKVRFFYYFDPLGFLGILAVVIISAIITFIIKKRIKNRKNKNLEEARET